jgi:formylglycine-generating enzyme required for sulfatase activity
MKLEIFKDTLFDWIEIPKGNVTLIDIYSDTYIGKKGEGKVFTVPAFAIAKYPVTNLHFAKFMDAKGYEHQKWWTGDGWQQKLQDSWTEPRFWNESEWNGDLQPVVGVSWYEAIAFCLWLSEVTDVKINLPTKQQWQRAAQALPDGRDSGFAYPWGNDWDCQRCNNSVQPCDSNVTTPVTAYAGKTKGDSPCGVVDMAGNVWEWCKTAYYTGEEGMEGTDDRVLCGGSWYNDDLPNDFRADYFYGDFPDSKDYDRGFRLARSYT